MCAATTTTTTRTVTQVQQVGSSNESKEGSANIETRIGFLMSPTPCGKFRRVTEYVSDAETKQLIAQYYLKKLANVQQLQVY